MIRIVSRATVVALLALNTSLALGQAGAPKVPDARRAMLEERLRERMGALVKQRLALNDAQMAKLQATNKQFEAQRTDLLAKERDARKLLRAQMLLGDSANQDRVGQLLDQIMGLERQRFDIQQNEQRELAKFLTPVQRAKLFALQNEMRRRTQELRNRQPRNGMRLN